MCHLTLIAMSTSNDKDFYGIENFDGSNFGLWKEQIQDILVQKKQRSLIAFATRQEAQTEHFRCTQYE